MLCQYTPHNAYTLYTQAGAEYVVSTKARTFFSPGLEDNLTVAKPQQALLLPVK